MYHITPSGIAIHLRPPAHKKVKFACSTCCDAKNNRPTFPSIFRCILAMPDPHRKFAITISESVLEGQHGRLHDAGPSIPVCSSYSRSQPPTVYGCASRSASSRVESSQTRSLPRSPRRLPIPPIDSSLSPSSSSTPSSSSSSLSLPIPKHPPHSWSVFVL